MASPAPILQPGSVTTATLQVNPSDLASAISEDPQDVFPDVFATQRLVAIMRIASARALKPLLQPGQLSVGVGIDVTHCVPTALGDIVIAEAKHRGFEDKHHVFDVVARDGGGMIGEAMHQRALVDQEKLESKARPRRAAKASHV